MLFLSMFSSLSSLALYIRSYYNKAFHTGYIFCLVFLLGAILYINYFDPVRINPVNKMQLLLVDYCIYFFPFAIAFLLQYSFFPGVNYLSNKRCWVLILVAPAIFVLRVNFPFKQVRAADFMDGDLYQFWFIIFKMLTRSLVLFVPVCLVWWLYDRDKQPLYGLCSIKKIAPFFILLAFMLPVVITASFQPPFLKTYPVFLNAVSMDLRDQNMVAILYEACYAFDFFSIEFFFRGFLVLAFIRICGVHAILPAACFYCCIHLDKPLAEAVSSFFGGLLLGIISYHSRSIWGGVIIHIGIAWLMELSTFLQRYG